MLALAGPFVRWIETKSASGETRAAAYAMHSTKITHIASHLTLPSCGPTAPRASLVGYLGIRCWRLLSGLTYMPPIIFSASSSSIEKIISIRLRALRDDMVFVVRAPDNLQFCSIRRMM